MNLWILVIGIGLALTAWLLEVWERRARRRRQDETTAALEQLDRDDDQ